jgi:hypothetical protein
MPTSSTARRATEPAAHQPGASNAPIPVPAATTDRFPSRGTSEPVDESPPGTGPVTPLQVCEARIREMAHNQQEALFAHAELDARVARLEGELALSREIERKASDALIRCLALEALFANSAIPSHIQDPVPIPSDGQVPQVSTGAKHSVTEMHEETQILPRGVKMEKSRKGKRHTKSPKLVDSDTDSEDLFLGAANYMAPEASFSPPWAPFRSGGPPLQASVNLSPLGLISECWYRIVRTASRTRTKSMTKAWRKASVRP